MYDVFYSPRGGNEAVPKALSFRMMCTVCLQIVRGHDSSGP